MMVTYKNVSLIKLIKKNNYKTSGISRNKLLQFIKSKEVTNIVMMVTYKNVSLINLIKKMITKVMANI